MTQAQLSDLPNEFPDIPEAELPQSPQREYFPVRFVQMMQQPVNAHAFIPAHNGFFRSGGRVGMGFRRVQRLSFFLPLLRDPDIPGDCAQPGFQAASFLKPVQGPQCLKKGFLGDFLGCGRVSGKGERIPVHRVKVGLVYLVKRTGLHTFSPSFHFIRRSA
jgi:hypothetical protein